MTRVPASAQRARPDEVVFARDIATGRVTWSPAIEGLFGYAPADVAPTVEWWAERLHPEDRERVRQVVRGAHNGHLLAAEYRFRRADGTYADVLGQAYAPNDASGAAAIAIGSIRDVSAPSRPTPQELGNIIKDEELRRQIRHVRLLLGVAAAANEATSPDAALQAAIDQICAVMGWPVGHVFLPAADGPRLLPTAIWHLGDAERYRELTEVTAATEFARGTGLPGRVLADGRPLFIPDMTSMGVPRGAVALRAGLRAAFLCAVTLGTEVAAVLEFFSAERLAASAELLEVMADVGTQLGHVIERERAQRATIHLALHDALTDLPNRHLLDDRLAQAIAVARRDASCVGLLFIDLDDFKSINDAFGHAAGDAALREAAARLRAALREQDTLARVGGDEFAAVLPHTDSSGAVDAARKLRRALDPALLVEGQRCHVSASVGIAVYPLHAEDELDLVRHADVALYSAKRAGTGFAVYGADGARLATLTTRERDVLELMADGLGNADTAARLVISVTTVRSHVRSIIEKLGVHSRLQAVVGAYELSTKGMGGGVEDHPRAIS